MNKKCKKPDRSNVIKIAVSILLLFVGVSSFGQTNSMNERNAWWSAIVKRHNIDMNLYNYNNSFTLTKSDTAFNESWLELGKSDSFKSENVIFKDAIFIIKGNKTSIYFIIRSELVYHNFGKNEITMEKSSVEKYDLNLKDINPITCDTVKKIKFDTKSLTGTFITEK